jgi:hypothetical protein
MNFGLSRFPKTPVPFFSKTVSATARHSKYIYYLNSTNKSVIEDDKQYSPARIAGKDAREFTSLKATNEPAMKSTMKKNMSGTEFIN